MQDDLKINPGGRVGGVQAIARAGALLRGLERAPGGASLGELAADVGLAKSTVHRIAAALAEEGLVVSAPDGRLVLGPALARLAAASRATLPERLRPTLEALVAEVGETVDLSVLDGAGVRFVDQVAAPAQRLRAVSAVGSVFPLHCTANGKALLAALGPERARALLPARPRRMTAATVTSREALMRELRAVGEHGVAFDREEHTEGICAVAAAVWDAAGPAAAISVPVPVQRFAGREQELAAALARAATGASALLGG